MVPLSLKSLKFRIAIVILTLEVAMMALVLGTTLKKYTDSNRQQWAATERAQLNLLSDLSRVALITAEFDELQPYFEQSISDPHILHIFLSNRSGQIVVSSDVNDVGHAVPELIDTQEQFWRKQNIENAAGLLGVLAINFSHSELLMANRDAMDLGLMIAAAGIIFIAFVSVLMGHLLTRRLRVLTKTAQRFSEGDLSAKTGFSGHDEIAVLGQSFDTMAENIEQHIASLNITELELRRARHDLERRVAERTAELAVARDQALEASRAKSNFLANMSHELRTPLNAVIGYSEMLAEDAQSTGYGSIVPDLNKIKSSGMHLLSLINDILDLSKIEAGKTSLTISAFPVTELIEETMMAVQPLIGKTMNTVRVNSAENIGVINTDKMKLRQVLINLLSNACKFTEQGEIQIDVNCKPLNGEDWIDFAVLDTGIGIEPGQVKKLFSEFYQVDYSTTRKYGGTGLGLAISQRFCQMLGGNITVASTPGKGSIFTISIPMHYKAESSGSFALPGNPAGEPPYLPLVGPGEVWLNAEDIPENVPSEQRKHIPTVLVIDDGLEDRDLLVRILARQGYMVEVATSGDEGIAIARRLCPDIITLDVVMPGLNGWEVLQQLKQDPLTAHIPVVMLTITEEEALGFSLGAAHFLSKPFDRTMISDVLARVLRKEVAAEQTRLETSSARS